MCRFSLVAALALSAIVAAAPLGTAAAQPADRRAEANAKEHYRKGIRFYDLGRFADAIKEFEAAYEFKEDPSYIYNLAQAHRRAGNLQKALDFYRTYLRKAPDAPDCAEVEGRITSLEQSLGPPNQARPPAEAGAATAPPPSVTPEPAPAAIAAAPEVTETAAAPPAPSSGRTLRIAGLVTAGAGVALAATGIVFGLQVRSKSDEANDATSFAKFRAAEESGKRAEKLQYAFLGIGAAAIATGGVLAYLGWKRDEGGSATSLAPAADGRGLVLTGAF